MRGSAKIKRIGDPYPTATLIKRAIAHYHESSIMGANPVTEWGSIGRGDGFDLDTVVGTAANLITLENGMALSPGATGDYFSTPDAAAGDVISDITIIGWVLANDWTPAGQQFFLSKWETTGNERSYAFGVDVAGTLHLALSETGAVDTNASSSVATSFTNGTGHWVRATWDDSANTVNFYTSNDDRATAYASISWTLLGSADVALSVAGINNSAQIIEVGSRDTGTLLLKGQIARMAVINSIDPTAAVVVDFDARDASVNTETWASASTSEVWTIVGDVLVNITGHTGIYSSGSVGLETSAGQPVPEPFTVFVVYKPTEESPSSQLIHGARSSGTGRVHLFGPNLKYEFNAGGAAGTLSEAYDNNMRVITEQFNGDATSKLTVSDVGSVTANIGSEDWDALSLFMDRGGGSTVIGLIMEMLIFDFGLSEGEITRIQNHLEGKYSV